MALDIQTHQVVLQEVGYWTAPKEATQYTYIYICDKILVVTVDIILVTMYTFDVHF